MGLINVCYALKVYINNLFLKKKLWRIKAVNIINHFFIFP